MTHSGNFSKVKRVVTGGLLTACVLAGASIAAYAAEPSNAFGEHVNPGNPEYQQVETIAQPVDESMVDFIESLDMLTRGEKDQLLKAEGAKLPYYKQMNELYDQIEEKTAAIVKQADPIIDRVFAIKDEHKDLWEKVDTHENEAQKAVGKDYIKFIELSDVLTKAEKELLIQDQMMINDLYKDVDVYYGQAADATADLTAKLDAVRAAIRDIDSQTDSIWEKVYAE